MFLYLEHYFYIESKLWAFSPKYILYKINYCWYKQKTLSHTICTVL